MRSRRTWPLAAIGSCCRGRWAKGWSAWRDRRPGPILRAGVLRALSAAGGSAMVGHPRPPRRPARCGARSWPARKEPDPPDTCSPGTGMTGYLPLAVKRPQHGYVTQVVFYENRRVRLCTCGHPYPAHQHYRHGTECSLCPDCPHWRPARTSLRQIIRLVKKPIRRSGHG
jgi:hypothetical protein